MWLDIVAMLMHEVNDGVLVNLLSMCEVMELPMYIALVSLDWDYE